MPARSFPGAGTIRDAVVDSLDKALKLAFDTSLVYIINEGLPVHPLTVAARNHLLALRRGLILRYDDTLYQRRV